MVRALNSLSEVGTMESYLNWLYNVVRGSRAVMCSRSTALAWSPTFLETVLPHVSGYRGMGPVRVGNQAQEHFQHVYGNVVLGAAQAFTTTACFDAGTPATSRRWS